MLCPAIARKHARAAALALWLLPVAYGQAAQDHFEVASIKPGGDSFSTKPQRSAGRFTWTTQLNYLIGYAYEMDFNRLTGQGLGSIYTVDAVVEPAAAESRIRVMLQALLVERFALAVHRSVKEADGYGISVGKAGATIKESVASEEPENSDARKNTTVNNGSYLSATLPTEGVTEITAKRASLSQLVETLGRVLGTPVWDDTGLQGRYDFTFRFSQDLSPNSPTDAPSLPTSLRENLGLILQKRRGPVHTLVIDHLEAPTEN